MEPLGHSRRRSMPANFVSSKLDPRGEKQAIHKKDSFDLDQLSIGNNWDKFLKFIAARRTLNSRKDEVAWRSEIGLTGSTFRGYDSAQMEDTFLQTRLERRIFPIFAYCSTLALLIFSEYAWHWYYRIFNPLATTTSLVILACLSISVYLRRLRKESLAILVNVAMALSELVHSPGFHHMMSPPYKRLSKYIDPSSLDAIQRRYFQVILFLILTACVFLFSSRISKISAIFGGIWMLHCFPWAFIFLATFDTHEDTEILVVASVPFLCIALTIISLGYLFQDVERKEFDQAVLTYEAERILENVQQTPRVSSGSHDLISGLANIRTESASSLLSDSVDSQTAMAHESLMDRRIRELQRVRNEYAIRRDKVVTTLIDICIGAMALNLRQKRSSNLSWAEYYQQNNIPSQLLNPSESRRDRNRVTKSRLTDEATAHSHMGGNSVNGGDKTLLTINPRRKRRRHSIMVINSPTTEIASSAPRLLDESAANQPAKMLSHHRRSSSADILPMSSLLVDHAIQPGDDVSRLNLEAWMSEWNFGTRAGIWTSLFSEISRLPLYADPLRTVTMQALRSLRLFDSLSLNLTESIFNEYLLLVEQNYQPRTAVPYHNALHACDVVQTVFAMISIDNLVLSEIASLALVIGACVHDLGHPGLSNAHLVAIKHELALTYNDRSVLENFHVSKAFSLMQSDPRYDILAGMRSRNKEMYSQFRTLLIDMVLSTDIKFHFEQETKLRLFLAEKERKGLFNVPRGIDDSENEGSHHDGSLHDNVQSPQPNPTPLDLTSPADASVICSTLLHIADVSVVAKPWETYKPWIDLLFDEFFAQGDREKELGMEVQVSMDRDQCVPANAQIHFISNLVFPLYRVLSSVIPLSSKLAIDNMEANLCKLRALAETHPRTASPAFVGQIPKTDRSGAKTDLSVSKGHTAGNSYQNGNTKSDVTRESSLESEHETKKD